MRVLVRDKMKRIIYILVIAFISSYSAILMFCFPSTLVMDDYLAHGKTVSGQNGEVEFFTPIPVDVAFQTEIHFPNVGDVNGVVSGNDCLLEITVTNKKNNADEYFKYSDYCELSKSISGFYSAQTVRAKMKVGLNVIKYSVHGGFANQKDIPIVMRLNLGSKSDFLGVTLIIVMLVKFMFVVVFGVFYSIFNIRG